MLDQLALNDLKPVDIMFFVILGVLVALAVAVYFLIPLFNKKQYKEQRENLHKREVAFKSNRQAPTDEQPAEFGEGVVKDSEETPAEAPAATEQSAPAEETEGSGD